MNMTDFKTVHSSAPERPAEIDTASSAVYVYERQNIRQEDVTVGTGEDTQTVTEWVYEQREYTKDEYDMMLSPAIQGVQQALSELQLAIDSL